MKPIVVFILAFLVGFQASLTHACGSTSQVTEGTVEAGCHQSVQTQPHNQPQDLLSGKVQSSHASCPFCVTQSCELKEYLFTKTLKESASKKTSKLILAKRLTLIKIVKSIARASSNYFIEVSVPRSWQALYSVFII